MPFDSRYQPFFLKSVISVKSLRFLGGYFWGIFFCWCYGRNSFLKKLSCMLFLNINIFYIDFYVNRKNIKNILKVTFLLKKCPTSEMRR